MDLMGPESSTDPRGHCISVKGEKNIQPQVTGGVALLFKVFLAAQNEPEVAKKRGDIM
jgi:hypothetical protein